jgi:hypothetical protein
MSIIKFKPHDYLTPCTVMLKQIKLVKDPEDFFSYPEFIRKNAHIENTSLNRPSSASNLGRPQLLPNQSPGAISLQDYQEIIKNKEYASNIKSEAYKMLSNHTDEAVAALSYVYKDYLHRTLQYNPITTFEGLWYILLWLRPRNLSQKTVNWLLDQSKKLICDNKLDLDYICKIYCEVCKDNVKFKEIWNFYNVLVCTYFNSMIPSQICIVSKGYLCLPTDFIQIPNIASLLNNFSHSALDEFTSEQIADVSCSMIKMKIDLKEYLVRRLKAEKIENDINYIYCVLSLSLDKQTIAESIKYISNHGSLEDKCSLLVNLYEFNDFKDVLFELSSMIAENANQLSVNEITKVVNYALDDADTQLKYALVQRIVDIIPTLSISDLATVGNLIGLYIHQEIDLPEEICDVFVQTLSKHLEDVSYGNLSEFVHLVSYLMPNKLGHEMLSDLIVSKNVPSTFQDKKPQNQYFYTLDNGKHVILNNSILSSMDLVSLAITLCCFKIKLQVFGQADEILCEYLKAVLQNDYYKLNHKHRTKIAVVISRPENFRKDLADSLFDNIAKSFKYKSREIYSYSTAYNIKNFSNLGYYHPIMDKIAEAKL